ncbi:hypothetical protein ALC57_05137 [Trachymyrmex cornetzi]|uniref:Integrase catalytic domain-containing protein n=1 Tax=Trachymyrmex cornetzi TaxID=471704 RepID=A0A151JBR4_9HYME|nr:hypothetical protein ALC57_05137 [Trachymyrmex cornetzi]
MSLCPKEIDEAEIRILRLLQAACFSNEIRELKNKKSITKGRIVNLNPFLDDRGLIRVGGRLQASNLSYSQKHPILLPSRHRLTDSIIREIHEKYHHIGIQTTLYIMRRRFWILDGRNQIRKIVRSCMRCFRFDAKSVEYKIGNLPPARVRETIPFAHTGIDFCGPFHIKEKKYRNRIRIKVYVCMFVCLSIKAAHFELVSDLSSEGFLAALRRFVSRRGLPPRPGVCVRHFPSVIKKKKKKKKGLPAHIYSDNGTNFVGANNELKELCALFNSQTHRDVVDRFAGEQRIIWHFIPPRAPHFGGIWEAMVKLFKHHLKRVVGDSLFTFEELNTFIIEVEGILNSRPITSLSSDPSDMLVLIPAHYMIGKPLIAPPESDVTSVPVNRISTWQHITRVRQHFWTRWSLEYLNELQIRNKWIKDGPNLEIGTIVLIKDKGLACNQWIFGRIVAVHPGEDGITRAATIKTATGEVKRATRSLCPVPIER